MYCPECCSGSCVVKMTIKLRVPETAMLQLVLGHLQRAGLIQSMRALEKESGLVLAPLGKDVAFFRELVMDGRWEEAELFIEPLRSSSVDYDRVNFYLLKQRFLEVAGQQSGSGVVADVKDVVSSLKALEGKCSQEEFHSLCYCLTLPSLKKHPSYADWDVYRGRQACFLSCLDHFKAVFPNQVPSDPAALLPGGSTDPLLRLCKQALLFQIKQFQKESPHLDLPSEITADLFSEKFQLPPQPSAPSQPEPSAPPAPMTAADDSSVRTTSTNRMQYHPLSRSVQALPTAATAAAQVGVPPLVTSSSAGTVDGSLRPMRDSILPLSSRPAGPSSATTAPRQSDRQQPPPQQERPTTTPSLSGKKPVAWEIPAAAGQAPRFTPSEPPPSSLPPMTSSSPVVAESRPQPRQEEPLPAASVGSRASSDRRRPPPPPSPKMTWRPVDLVKDSHPIRAVTFDSQGRRLCYGSNGGALRVCDLWWEEDDEEGQPQLEALHERFSHHRGSVYCLSWSCDDELLASGSNDKAIKVMRVGDGVSSLESEDVVLHGHTGTVRDVAFSPRDPSCLASGGGGDLQLRLWDVNRPDAVRAFAGHSRTIFTVSFVGGGLVASAGEDGLLALWDTRKRGQGPARSIETAGPIYGMDAVEGRAVTSHADGSVRLWDVGSGGLLGICQPSKDQSRSVHLCRPDSRLLLSTAYDGTVTVMDANAAEPQDCDSPRSRALRPVFHQRSHSSKVLQGRWQPRHGGDHPAFVTSGADGVVKLWV